MESALTSKALAAHYRLPPLLRRTRAAALEKTARARS